MNGPPGYDAPAHAVPICNGPPGYGPLPTPPQAMPACRDCRFFRLADAQGAKPSARGVCHRFPPMTGYPALISQDHWCGEFSRKAQG